MSYQQQEFKVFNIQECYFSNKNTLCRVDKKLILLSDISKNQGCISGIEAL